MTAQLTATSSIDTGGAVSTPSVKFLIRWLIRAGALPHALIADVAGQRTDQLLVAVAREAYDPARAPA